jgi:PEP-CTERM motif
MQFLKLAAGAAALLLAGQAHAATWFVKYNSTGGDPLSAALTVTSSNVLNSVGGYNVTGITGTVAGDLVTGLIGNPTKPNFSYSSDGLFIFDNVIFAGAPNVSWGGLFFSGKSGAEYNLFSDNASTYELYAAQDGHYLANSVGFMRTIKLAGGDVSPSNGVPEPAAWTMMIVGFGGIGAMMRRRRLALATA